jgi:hypothetical protein
VFVDTLTNATNYDLCRATENKAMMTPLRDIAQRTQTPIIPLLHLSKDGQALGRRIKGITRTIIQLDCPDHEHSGRLKLWVPKSFAPKPPPLGVTMKDDGNDYDFNPPTAPEPTKGGRPPESRDKAVKFIREKLKEQNNQTYNDLRDEWVKNGGVAKRFADGMKEMEAAGELTKDGGPGTRSPLVLHLIRSDPDSAPGNVP